MRKKQLTLIICLFMAIGANAQTSITAVPLTVGKNAELNAAQYVPEITLSQPAIPATSKAKRGRKNVLPPALIGVTSNADAGFDNAGSITELQDGSKVWRLQIAMPGAKALGLYYDKFKLPVGVNYFLFNGNRKQLLGAYTAANNPADGYWVTEKVQGDIINLELDIAPDVNVNDIVLHINKVADFYAGISYLQQYAATGANEKKTGGPYYPFNGSSPCEINAICPLGSGLPDQRHATVNFEYLIGNSGVAAASATLINNTRQDCTPYILTASHTEGTNSKSNSTFSQWMFYFNYETPTCSNTVQPVPQTINGASFVARSDYNENSDTIKDDFLLLKLNQQVPASYGAYFAGWDMDTTILVGTFIGFHHPAGDVKKVSKTHIIDPTGDVMGALGTHWQTLWDSGYVEEGSSGSGLYNNSGRLIGIASVAGPEAPACTDTNFIGSVPFDYVEYSKFARDWENTVEPGITATGRLKDWLDPDNTGLTHIDAMAASCAPNGIQQVQPAEDAMTIYPNPSNGVVYATVKPDASAHIHIEVFDMIGNRVYERAMDGARSNIYTIDLSRCAAGMYMVHVSTDKMQVTRKIIINR